MKPDSDLFGRLCGNPKLLGINARLEKQLTMGTWVLSRIGNTPANVGKHFLDAET
ncbi:MAG: hypothetical protein ACYC0X_15535 [Pirellulaceae bacterium]